MSVAKFDKVCWGCTRFGWPPCSQGQNKVLCFSVWGWVSLTEIGGWPVSDVSLAMRMFKIDEI